MKRLVCSLLALAVALSPVKAETLVCAPFSTGSYAHLPSAEQERLFHAADKLSRLYAALGHPVDELQRGIILVMLTEAHLDASRVLEDGATLVALSVAVAHAARPFGDGKGCFDLEPLRPYAKPVKPNAESEAGCGNWICEAAKKRSRGF